MTGDVCSVAPHTDPREGELQAWRDLKGLRQDESERFLASLQPACCCPPHASSRGCSLIRPRQRGDSDRQVEAIASCSRARSDPSWPERRSPARCYCHSEKDVERPVGCTGSLPVPP